MPTGFPQRARAYFDDTVKTIRRLDEATLLTIYDLLCDAYHHDRQVFLMGNGGSAALASHFAVDMGKGTVHAGHPRFRVVSLVDNTPVMTAYANDVSYADVFSEQIRTLVQSGDIVFGISGSGNSPNILQGLAAARERGAKTVVFTGYQGGKAAGMADVALIVPSHDMQHIEDCHLMLMHLYMQAMREVVGETRTRGAAAGSPR